MMPQYAHDCITQHAHAPRASHSLSSVHASWPTLCTSFSLRPTPRVRPVDRCRHLNTCNLAPAQAILLPSEHLQSRTRSGNLAADLETEAVLNIDDDIAVSCATLHRTLAVWRRHPHQLVGWFPRLATGLRGAHTRYRSKITSLLLRAKYNIVLTKGAVMHRRYLDLYSERLPAATRAMVAELRNCEDIAMQFLVSNATGEAPVFVWDPWCAPCQSLPRVVSVRTQTGLAAACHRAPCHSGAETCWCRIHKLDKFSHWQSCTSAANLTQIIVSCRLRDAGAGAMPAVPGISSAGGKHFATRSACIAALQTHFGGMQSLPQRGVWHRPLQRLSPFLDALGTLLPRGRRRPGCRCAMRRSQH